MTPLHKALVVLACALLPRRHRLRYRGEFVSELASLPVPERSAHALSTLRSAPHLRAELVRGDHRPLACRVGIHHNRRAQHPEDMRIRSRVCLRCGRIKDLNRYLVRGNAEGVAYANVFVSQGH
ncbi:MAG: hypothetical protein LCH66_12930 [Actinobacteria bacterium]|jgi:hypothetical protein|nr:hypothetical protein [Actinomycetota bacterium]